VKTLHQMFGPKGNPTATNLFNIIACLQEHEGVKLQVVRKVEWTPGPKNQTWPRDFVRPPAHRDKAAMNGHSLSAVMSGPPALQNMKG